MLTHLRITDLGVITESELEPSPGLTAITGETGAGKTMIVTGLNLLLGTRADATVVRHGARRAHIEGRFTDYQALASRLEEIGADLSEDELLVARQITSSGRSRAYLGGAQVPIGLSGEMVAQLATVHGQSEQIRLATSERQREVLDRFGGDALAEALQVYRSHYQKRRELQAELTERVEHARERAHEHDMLAFGLNEISAVNPQPGEDDELNRTARRLQAADELHSLAEQASHALSGADDGDATDPGAVGLMGIARQQLRRIVDLDPQAGEIAAELDQLTQLTQDCAAELAGYLSDIDNDPGQLEQVISRRAQLAGLTRKYGDTIDQVLAWAEDAATRMADLGTDDERIEQLKALIAQLDTEIAESGQRLHELRAHAAERLTQQTEKELSALAMPHARLIFRLDPLAEPGAWGLDHVQLLFSANPGSQPAPLAKTASGGELSRVRLALEVVLAGSDPGHTFVFDEVDAGVGGQVAIEIGRRLARLAEHSQVIVVTHLAQVAAFADRHFVVAKSSDGQVTTSDIRLVSGKPRETEIARLMAGTQSALALRHAKELLAQAQG